jgi:hypothetical protein
VAAALAPFVFKLLQRSESYFKTLGAVI